MRLIILCPFHISLISVLLLRTHKWYNSDIAKSYPPPVTVQASEDKIPQFSHTLFLPYSVSSGFSTTSTRTITLSLSVK